MLGLIKKIFGIGSVPTEAAPYKIEVPAPVVETATQAMVESLVPAAVVTAENKTRAAAAVKRVPANKTPAKKTQKKPAENKTPVR